LRFLLHGRLVNEAKGRRGSRSGSAFAWICAVAAKLPA
jgi:hypothetical protein